MASEITSIADAYHNGFVAGAEAFHHLMDLLNPLVEGRLEGVDYVGICNAHAAVAHLIHLNAKEGTE